MIDLDREFKDFQDWLAPRLDTYEQAIYLYILRHGPLQGLDAVVIGFKSARKKMAFGIGEHGKPMSEGSVYKKLTSLAQKGAVTIVGSERDGTRVRLLLPSQIPGLIPVPGPSGTVAEADFFTEGAARLRIVAREGARCFYCLRELTPESYVIEHVVSRPIGDNTFRNLVAACRECNNSKDSDSAEDHLRRLYQKRRISADIFDDRLVALDQLFRGQLVPPDEPLRDWM